MSIRSPYTQHLRRFFENQRCSEDEVAKIFISSTGRDLQAYRQAAIEACNEVRHVPIAMEFFDAVGKGATEGSKRQLDEADVHVAIVAHRYGYIEDGYDRSVTEIEFDYAGERGLDRLCFVVDPSFPWPTTAIDHASYPRLESFKAKIDKLIRSSITTAEDFRTKLIRALIAWQREREGDTPSVGDLVEKARTATARFVEQVTADGVFDPDLYQARHEAELQVSRFRGGSAPAMLLLGASGTGKTSLVASLGSNWLSDPSPSGVVLLLAAASFSSAIEEIERSVAAELALRTPLSESAAKVAMASRGDRTLKVLVVLDGLDRHPDPVAVMQAVHRIAHSFRNISRTFCLLATCTPISFESACRAEMQFLPDVFYQPQTGLMDGRTGRRSCGFVLGTMTPRELEDAYRRYRRRPGTSPATAFEDLTRESREALSHPLTLRIAMEVFAGKPIPSRFFSGDMLMEFAQRRVFSDPKRADFIAALLDHMVERQKRSLSFHELLENVRLRPSVLDDGTGSPFVSLRDAQILSCSERTPWEGLRLPPQQFVEFSFEQLLCYLLEWRIASRAPDCQTALDTAFAIAPNYLPMRGALLLMLSQLARSGVCEPARKLLSRQDEQWSMDLLCDLFVELLETHPSEASSGVAPEPVAVELARTDPAAVDRTLSRAAEMLFLSGRWWMAYKALSTASALPGLDPEQTIRQQNRLVVLSKNMDRWAEAREHSTFCFERLDACTSPGLIARIHVNRGSVLYDLGERAEAAKQFQTAFERSLSAGSTLELAAAANNLGIYHLYHDELDPAETILRRGLEAARTHAFAPAYLSMNLGLVLWTRALVDGRLEEPEQIFARLACEFQDTGHLQGISYAVNNRGICELARNCFDKARESFQETLALARKIGERWSVYGSTANLALLRAVEPDGDLNEAWADACQARDMARANSDPKGIGDAGLIAAYAALERADKAGAEHAPLDDAGAMLEEAAASFHVLGQRLGEAEAWFGLMAIANHRNRREEADAAGRRGRQLLGQTSLSSLPARLLPLPWHMLLLMELF